MSAVPMRSFYFVLVGFLFFSSSLYAEDIRLTVIHSNDVSGQLMRRGDRGGMAARVGLIRKLQTSEPAIVLDAGDALGPNAMSRFDAGATMCAAMNRANYAAMTVGNHDLSLGWDVLETRQKEIDFPMLAANLVRKDGGKPPLPGYTLVKAGDVQAGIIGVLGPQVAHKINPGHLSGLRVGDPVKVVDSLAVVLRAKKAQCVIVLAHMDETSALNFAREVEGVDLVVAGGFSDLDRGLQVPGLIRLVNGLTLVVTPSNGVSIGRVELHLAPDTQGNMKVVDVSAEQIPVDRSVERDPEVEQLVNDLRQRYEQVANQRIGRIAGKTYRDQGRIVTGLMRRYLDGEVGIINRGGLGLVPSNRVLKVGHIDHLIPFDDRLVKMRLTGAQLLSIFRRSQNALGEDAQLIFSGLKKNTINGRPIQKNELYRVVVVEFLANGGDGYGEFRKGTDVVFTGMPLRQMVVYALRDTQAVLVPRKFATLRSDGIWHMNWTVKGAFNRNYIDGTTLAYRAERERVSFLSGRTSLAWNTTMNLMVVRDMGKQLLTLDQSLVIGQVGTAFDNLTRSEDQMETDLIYRYRTQSVADPFVLAGYSTALREVEGQRPRLLRGSMGFQRRFGRRLIVRLGARGQRDLAVDANDIGAEVYLDYRQSLGSGKLRSRLRSFTGFTDRHVVSLENYNSLAFPLVGELSLSVQQNNFLYRVNRIGNTPVDGIANRWNLTLGLVYDLGWKWY